MFVIAIKTMDQMTKINIVASWQVVISFVVDFVGMINIIAS